MAGDAGKQRVLSADSGVFMRPKWKGPPGSFERVTAVLLVLLNVVCFWLITIVVGLAPPDAAREIQRQLMEKAGNPLPHGLPLAADNGTAGHRGEAGALPLGYGRGRAVMMAYLTTLATAGRPAGDNRRASDLVGLCMIFGLVLIGSVVAFFGWRLRRLASALFGAGAFGLTAGIVSLGFGMSSWGCLCVALPPAFLGALIGWHLMVLVTCAQAATMMTALTAVPVILAAGLGHPQVIVPVLLGLWTLYAALIYIFMVRSLLISGWAIWGAWSLAQAALVATYHFSGVVVPWEVYLLAVAIIAVLGVRTQYWLAGRAAADADLAELEAEPEPA